LGKVETDKRCQHASDDNENAKDAEKHGKARSRHRAEEHDADVDAQHCRDVNPQKETETGEQHEQKHWGRKYRQALG